MGLDVYLYRYEDKDKSDALDNRYDKATTAVYNRLKKKFGNPERFSDQQSAEYREELRKVRERLGYTDEYGCCSALKQKIERDSAQHPEHYWKIGYFRSSYNEGGIERRLRILGIPGLSDIFNPGDEYEFRPDWSAAKDRCLESLRLYTDACERMGGMYTVSRASANVFSGLGEGPKTEKEALDLFYAELERHRDWKPTPGWDEPDRHWYSNKDGEYFMGKPLEVCALIPGTESVLRSGWPTCYVIAKASAETQDFYRHCLEIAVETCDYVLAQPDTEKYWLHWSG